MCLVGLASVRSMPGRALASSKSVGVTLCGVVQAVDLFVQVFLIRQDDGKIETVPFSRWTDFSRIVASSSGERRERIEPTDITRGDRLYILLDPSEATAARIIVLPTRFTGLAHHVGGKQRSALNR